jgi:hypothetical protein
MTTAPDATTTEDVMHPEQLHSLLTSMEMALTVAEAIANPILQRVEGWDLSGWTCEVAPGVMRFRMHDPCGRAAVVAYRPAHSDLRVASVTS